MIERIFISHASEDAAVADKIVAYLEARGVACWIAPRNIPPSAAYPDAIADAIENCSACAVLLSKAANASTAIKRELELASQNEKPFIPIRIDSAAPSGGLAYYLGKHQWVDFKQSGERALDHIVSHMAGGGDAHAVSRSPPGHRGARAAPRRNLGRFIGIGAVLLAAGVGWLGFAALQNQRPGLADRNIAGASTMSRTLAEPPAPLQRSSSESQASDRLSAGEETDRVEPDLLPPGASPPESTTNIATRPEPLRAQRPEAHPLFQALAIEPLASPDQSPLVFPTAFFNRRLQQELGARSTSIDRIRLAVVFVEPRATRRQASGGTVIGHFLVSLPSLPGCVRQFGGPSYPSDNATTALMSAVNEAAPDIATWLVRASSGEELSCPD
ncbi:toll/interleukin-1 receptor domain-containing protein [Terricaulis sp.]|uniref:toll/interleukin-1 receptor domain-containing protein n=1 Tax=Terricaulis sp. TaxID=2768686 RepID=UPI00378471D0